MTTIAWDGKTLAGDRQRACGNTPVPTTKVFRATKRNDPCMVAYGCAGDSNDCIAFQEWVRGGEKPAFKSLAVLAVDEAGHPWYMDEGAKWWPIGRPVWAVGSGADYAIGAMAAGKSAREAVEIATEWDVHTGLGVDVLEL